MVASKDPESGEYQLEISSVYLDQGLASPPAILLGAKVIERRKVQIPYLQRAEDIMDFLL